MITMSTLLLSSSTNYLLFSTYLVKSPVYQDCMIIFTYSVANLKFFLTLKIFF